MAKKITVLLDEETSEFSVDLTGFQGVGCADIERAFNQLGNTTKSIKKPEYKQTKVNLQTK
jgi:hypothetical protein